MKIWNNNLKFIKAILRVIGIAYKLFIQEEEKIKEKDLNIPLCYIHDFKYKNFKFYLQRYNKLRNKKSFPLLLYFISFEKRKKYLFNKLKKINIIIRLIWVFIFLITFNQDHFMLKCELL